MSTLSFGPFSFAAPLALIALLALPVLFWLIRASPPPPKVQIFPGVTLLDGLSATEVTPHRTPWPVVLLRIFAAGLAILAFARPSYSPQPLEARPGPVLLVIDDGWPSAPRWRDVREQALATIGMAAAAGEPVHLLLTANAATAEPGVAEALSASYARARVEALSPSPWPVDRAAALAALEAAGLSPGRVVWITDGVEDVVVPGTLDPAERQVLPPAEFAARLAALASTEVRRAETVGPMTLTAASGGAEGLTARVVRMRPGPATRVLVAAESADGRAVASAFAEFAPDSLTADVKLVLPVAVAERVSRLRLRGVNSAGSVWLLDDASVRRRIGIVEGRAADQPLLSDAFYLRRALSPFADIVGGDLAQVLEGGAQAVLLPDSGVLPPDEAERMTEFLEQGGVLIRFGGPRLATEADGFVPVTLRQAERALGGALEWSEPQPIAAYPPTSPFFGLTPPQDARVRAQVLAEPAPDLAARTWASLADGTPLVTADRRGEGLIVLFHVTARPDWSDLPLAGQFVDLLRRSLAAGMSRGGAEIVGDKVSLDLALDGFGRLGKADVERVGLDADALTTAAISHELPPGLYRAQQGRIALNAGNGAELVAMGPLPGVSELDASAPAARRLDGGLLSVAAGLVMLDLLIALALAGTLWPRRAQRLAVLAVLLGAGTFVTLLPGQTAFAQTFFDDAPTRRADLSEQEQAALGLHFGYVRSGSQSLDQVTRAGLEGLSLQLFRRTSVEPGEPHGLDLETSPLELYPFIYMALADQTPSLSVKAVTRLNAYLRSGGALLIDTREASAPTRGRLQAVMQGLDAPPLAPLGADHVLTRAFYLLKAIPGRNGPAQVWLEATQAGASRAGASGSGAVDAGSAAGGGAARGDGISGLFIGSGDWAAAWAVDDRGRALLPVEGGEATREQTYRFGINLVMYILTGNYKEDQVHLPALLERLEQ